MGSKAEPATAPKSAAEAPVLASAAEASIWPCVSISERADLLSIRGSNARNTFGIRNIVVLEDGFSVAAADVAAVDFGDLVAGVKLHPISGVDAAHDDALHKPNRRSI